MSYKTLYTIIQTYQVLLSQSVKSSALVREAEDILWEGKDYGTNLQPNSIFLFKAERVGAA